MQQMATTTLQEIDKLANLYNKTKDDKYKILWYKKIKEWANVQNTNNTGTVIRWDFVKRKIRTNKTNGSSRMSDVCRRP
tara:strand:+ start:150 stop:386 length:237 start_codon:yes stop_codon:yes gene_type:complete